jgi:hypothetical protein
MASLAINGRGLRFRRYDGAAYVDLAEVRDIPDVDPTEREIRDVTSQDTPSGRDAKIGGILRGGQLTLNVFWVPGNAGHEALITDRDAGTVRSYQIKMAPTGSSRRVTFDAIVTKVTIANPVSDEVTASVTLERTGDQTWDTGV